MVGKVEMNSFTSNSDTYFNQVQTFILWVWSHLPMVVVTAILALAMGEVYMQATFLPSIFYQFDSELEFTYVPDQKSIVWQGNYSVPSPPIRINSNSNRGSETDWSKKMVVALGSSEVMGPGIEDEQTWSANLEQILRENAGNDSIEVVNAGTGGYGPYHHSVAFERILENHDIDSAIIRASVGDRNFGPPKHISRKGSLHKFLRDHTVFIRYLINKTNAQVRLIKRSFVPFPFRKKVNSAHTRTLKLAEKMWSENESYWMRAIEAAIHSEVKLVFLIVNPTNSDGESYLARRLSELCKTLRYGVVLEIGPQPFGLEDVPPSDRKKVFERNLTLGYDPHGNPKQHEVIAESIRDFLMEQQAH